MWEVPLTPSGLCGEEWGELETVCVYSAVRRPSTSL